MSCSSDLIRSISPNIVFQYRLHTLLDLITKPLRSGLLLLSIEKNHDRRHFCAIDYAELDLLYEYVPRHQRCFYEIISSESVEIKAYIDFEYPTDNNSLIDRTTAISTCLKILYACINKPSEIRSCGPVSMREVLDQFLVLQA